MKTQNKKAKISYAPRKKWIYEPVYKGTTLNGQIIEGLLRKFEGNSFLAARPNEDGTGGFFLRVDEKSMKATGRYVLGHDD